MASSPQNPTLQTDIILGKNLPEEVIKMMENQRLKEYGAITKDFRHHELDSTFFFLTAGAEVKAFGLLKPVTLYYDDKQYQIMGIANVIAIEKSKGFGTILMRQITNYLEDHNLVGIGNTYKDNFVFYEKCGYTFIPGLLARFKYRKTTGEEVGTETQDYTMFVYDSHHALRDVLTGLNPVIIKVPFW